MALLEIFHCQCRNGRLFFWIQLLLLLSTSTSQKARSMTGEAYYLETIPFKLLKDFDLALKESSAKWKIVVGHHTIKSAGHHGKHR
ncbi:hypothetical protein I3843_06G053700 [Carya illinoinensis]|nr:hypothetical protein I3843_06G053700 [Carya illinoinensis]